MPRKSENVTPKKRYRSKTGKTLGRPKGSFTDMIPKWKQEQMYAVWKETPVLNHVSRECHVGVQTIKRYWEKNEWEKRKALELQADKAVMLTPTEDKSTELEIATEQAISRLTIILGKTLDALMDLKFTKAEQAWKAYKEAQELLLELKGRTASKHVSLILIAAERFQAQAKQAPKDITASAEITDGGDDAK